MIICIVIPAMNEEDAIGETILEYRAAFPEARIVVVNNNSTDRTEEIARAKLDPERDLLLSESRKGKGYAVKTGLCRLEADIYVMTDGDSTYPAEHARKLVDTLLETRADMIVGDRVSGGAYSAQNTRPGHNLGNRVLTVVISGLAGKEYRDVFSGLRIMSRPFVGALDIRSSGFQVETEINLVAAYLRADVIETPISYRERPENSHSKLNTFRDGMRIVSFAVVNWIAFAPMQVFVILAVISSLVALLLGYRVIAGFLETGWPYTTTATIASGSGIVAILSLFFGISLRILGRNTRRQEIANFLEEKRKWNTRLDG